MADVHDTLPEWSPTTGSNNPQGSTTIGTGLDDNVRELQGVVVRWLSHKGADIASAGTTDLGAVDGLLHDITGTATITGFGTIRSGIWKVVKFEGAALLTHNATSLILPGAANITTADGDVGIFMSEGSGNWRCLHYLSVASQAVMEAAASLAHLVTPGRLHNHPGVAKAWGVITPATTVTASYPSSGVSVVQDGTGIFTVTHGRTFSSGDYASVSQALNASSLVPYATARTTTTVTLVFRNDAGTLADPTSFSYALFGDL